jgi:hypothetical protein
MKNIDLKDEPPTCGNVLLAAGWLNPKTHKPHLGQKVLVRMQWKTGIEDYNVAIYAINSNDKRKRGFFQNYDNQLKDGNIMRYDSWEYTNVVSWMPIPTCS